MKQTFFVAECKELYGNESDISRADIYTHIETVKKVVVTHQNTERNRICHGIG